MFNYYIDENSYENIGSTKFENNLVELTKVLTSAQKEEFFYKNDSKLWIVNIEGTKNFSQLFLHTPKFNKINGIHGIFKRINGHTASFNEMCKIHTDEINASWGANFNPKQTYNLTNFTEYENFKHTKAAEIISPSNFESLLKFTFNKIKFCENAQAQIPTLDINVFNTFLKVLLKLDDFNNQWKTGDCTAKELTAIGLKISGEKETVNSDPKLRHYREFKLPDGRIEYFELHIKKGDKRMHIFPDVNKKIIYIGYIGNHFPTAKFKK